jgi:V-type H+-transporting ATPase proteolipid subunit
VAIYGVIVAIILQTKIEPVKDASGKIAFPADGMFDKYALSAGYAIFSSGVTCGFANLVCG